MKTKVISVRLRLEDLQSCFDLCNSVRCPTDIASTAISRALSILLQNLRSSKALPTHTEPTLLENSLSFKEKLLSISLGDGEIEKDIEVEKERDIEKEREEHLPMFEEDILHDAYTSEPDLSLDRELEDEITKQIRLIEMEEEIDLLSKILIT